MLISLINRTFDVHIRKLYLKLKKTVTKPIPNESIVCIQIPVDITILIVQSDFYIFLIKLHKLKFIKIIVTYIINQE